MAGADILTPMLAGTQCTRCGYDSCAAYAGALVEGAAANLCVPGGERVARRLAAVLGRDYVPVAEVAVAELADIREVDCIGCTLCIQKCPTGAIVGAPKQVHTVLAADCTGCGLCVPVCPADCIEMVEDARAVGLTGVLGDEASAKVWRLVEAVAARAEAGERGVKVAVVSDKVELAAIGGDLAAKIAAAREKSSAKYAAKGALQTPKVLRRKKH